MEPKVIGGGEKKIMYAIFGLVDAAQLILVETLVIGTFIDVGAGIVLLVYGLIRKLWTTKKVLILLATFIGEAIPLINAFPFWVGDVANLFSGTITPEEAEAQNALKNWKPEWDRPANTVNDRGEPTRPPVGNGGQDSHPEPAGSTGASAGRVSAPPPLNAGGSRRPEGSKRV